MVRFVKNRNRFSGGWWVSIKTAFIVNVIIIGRAGIEALVIGEASV
jgi:hypothetical protein